MKMSILQLPFDQRACFIAGQAKSGTTLLVALLDNHPELLVLPEETAYRLARAVHKGERAFAARLEQARETTMANTLSAAKRRELIHPGVLKYLSEAGIPGAR